MRHTTKTAFIIFATVIVTGMATADFAGGSGTSDDPYEISTCQQLQDMQNDLDASYELINDIDCSGFNFKSVGEDFGNGFDGTLDGKGYDVNNLEIDEEFEFNVGLIGFSENGFVTDIGVVNADISGGTNTGGVIGDNDGDIGPIHFSGNVSGDDDVGGLVGSTESSVSGFSNANVSGDENVGGLVGSAGRFVFDSYSRGSVSGDRNVGGLVGLSGFDSSVGPSFSTASVSGSENAGGLIGNTEEPVDNSFSTGQVSDDADPFIGKVAFGVDGFNNYWDIESSGSDFTFGNATGLTTSEMQGSEASNNMNLDFSSTWIEISAENGFAREYYPWLREWKVPVKYYFPDGEGTSSDPYHIRTCQQLQNMNKDLDAHYELVENIDCSDTENWNSGAGFEPIGSIGTKFTGDLEGNGYVISNLESSNGGIFDVLGGESQISELGLSHFSVTAGRGLLSHRTYGSTQISRIYTSGNSTGGGRSAGIVSQLRESSSISKSYSTAKVSGAGLPANGPGGIAKGFGGTVTNTYFRGNLTNQGYGSANILGFTASSGDIEDVYWDKIKTSNQKTLGTDTVNLYGADLSTQEMTGESAESNMDLDFSSTWQTVSTQNSYSSDGYPILRDVNKTVQLREQGIVQFAGGQGTEADPFEINSCQMLQGMNKNLDAHYELVENIDCSDTRNWNSGEGFEPIGKSFGDPFSGTFVGNNFTIKDLYATSQNEAGLFAQLKDGGVVKDFKLSNATIIGEGSYVGGVVGDNQIGITTPGGKIKNVIFEGSVNGTSTGGIAGRSNGEIIRVYVDGEIHGTIDTAGIVGSSFSGGDIKYAHNAANVTGPDVAGISGRWSTDAGTNLPLEINNTINTGKLNGTNSAGGILGPFAGFQAPSNAYLGNSISAGNVTGPGTTRGIAPEFIEAGDTQNLYWDKKSTGQQYAGSTQDFNGATGLTTSEMQGASPKCQGTMSGLDFRNTWVAKEGAEYPQLSVFVDQGVSSVSNSNAPEGSVWVQDNALHWADGSNEHFLDFQGEAACDVNGDNGGFWVQGSTLRWIDQDGDERVYEGSKVQDSASGPQGATWFQNGFIHYIDGNGDERRTDGF